MAVRRHWIPITLTLVVLLPCSLIMSSLEWIIPSFPDFFLGQVVLTRDSKPLFPRAYQSAEFVLKRVDHDDIEGAVFIALREDVLFWDPHYAGFARTELSRHEIRRIQQLLSEGTLFDQGPTTGTFQCVTKHPATGSTMEPCVEGSHFQEQYLSIRQDAIRQKAVGVLQFYFSGGRMAEIRVYPSEEGIAYSPYEKSGDWWFDGITSPSKLLDDISTRVTLGPIEVLWPKMNTARANARAARIIGHQHQSAIDLVEGSPVVREVFGEIQDIRPAAGVNTYASWMDSTSVFLTFRVLGTRGEGVVLIQGYDCFDLQMVFHGIPVDDGRDYLCP